MTSPFPASTAAPGAGRIVVGLLPSGESALEALSYQYPLKLIAPSARTALVRSGPADAADASATPANKSALVFLLSYGGGLVAGDQVNLAVDVRPHARLSIVTQGTTKVFKAPSVQADQPPVVTRQRLHIRLAPGAALCLLPDPVQPFADSVYEQVQSVRMRCGDETTAAASLCLLDWVTQGRAARGENWSFTRWQGRNEVWAEAEAPPGARLLLRDSVKLAAALLDGASPDPLRRAMHELAVAGTLLLRGPLVEELGAFFLAEFAALPRLGSRGFRDEQVASEAENAATTIAAWRARRLQLEQTHGVLWSAASVRGCVVVKFGARTVEGGRLWIGSMLERQGTVAAVFGEQALMCVR